MLVRNLAIPLFMTALVWLCAAQGPAEETRQGTSTESALQRGVKEVLLQQETAWNHGDVDRFMDGYWKSPEVTFAGAAGVSRGWEAVRDRYHERYPNKAAMGELEFSRLEIRALGSDSALVLGRWHLQREGGNLGGVFTLVFQRFGEGWRIVHDHTSVDATAKP